VEGYETGAVAGDEQTLYLYDLVARRLVVFPSHANDHQHLYQPH